MVGGGLVKGVLRDQYRVASAGAPYPHAGQVHGTRIEKDRGVVAYG